MALKPLFDGFPRETGVLPQPVKPSVRKAGIRHPGFLYNHPMIAHLRGRLLAKHPQQAIIEAGGVGYDVVISVSTYSALPAEGKEVALYIHTHVREDALALYGFLEAGDKRIFERLITVSGVGPKLAVTIQSGLSSERLVGAIRGQDHATLSQIPGIGKRLAERLVVDLKDKLEDMGAAARPVETGPATEDVLSALVNLGYQRPLAQKAIAAAVTRDKNAAENFETLFRASMAAMRS